MGRVRIEDFEDGTELTRIYLAATLDEARRVEEVLDRSGYAYAIEVEHYATLSLLAGASRSRGAAFYVPSDEAGACVDALTRANLLDGLADEVA